jgi:hypothetical protein
MNEPQETDWFPLTHCPVHPGVYKTLHLGSDRKRIEGYSKWQAGRGWSQTQRTIEEADIQYGVSLVQSKQWKGLIRD